MTVQRGNPADVLQPPLISVIGPTLRAALSGRGSLHVAAPRGAAYQRGSSRDAPAQASLSVGSLLTRAPLTLIENKHGNSRHFEGNIATYRDMGRHIWN
jgi:hypothetical protein